MSRPDVETLGHGLQLVVNSGMVVYTVGVCCFSVGSFSQVLHTAKYTSFRNASVQSAKMRSMCTNIRALGHASDSGAVHNLTNIHPEDFDFALAEHEHLFACVCAQ